MHRTYVSNTLLLFGVLVLTAFAVMEVAGLRTDPLVPAFSAFLIGCTAVLDRLGAREWNQ